MHLFGTKKAKCLTRSHPLSRDNVRLFNNRELSWIEFNHRVLHEAKNVATPLLERIKFLGIISANVDEFYMKRLGGLKQKIASGKDKPSIDGLTPSEQLEQCRLALKTLQVEKESTYCDVYKEMVKNAIEICRYTSLRNNDKKLIADFYRKAIEPHIELISIDPARSFPFLSNLSLYLLLSERHKNSELCDRTLIKIPTGKGVSRFIRVGNTHKFVLLEDIIFSNHVNRCEHIDKVSSDLLRVTRSAVSHRDYKELDDQREIIEEELHDRKYASVVRLQVSPLMDSTLRRSLARSLGLDYGKDVATSAQILRMSDLQELASLDIPLLREEPLMPVLTAELSDQASIFETIRTRTNILLQHPYESFTDSVERFVFEASHNANVVAIKMTLYRTSADTKIVDYLIGAALRGKQVSVVVELKARFDEASNLRWARRLESAGVHVNHGRTCLKTHCKFILVVKRDQDKLRQYAHIGTGNYHAGTAQQYVDIGLLSCDEVLTSDIAKLYTFLTTSNIQSLYFKHILATPHVIKAALLAKIRREVDIHGSHSSGYLCMKTNALEDADITLELYRAAQAGVTINLIVRDICRLRPKIIGLSENINVISIVGRFLEHSRIYHFGNNGEDEIYMGSADLMTRNLERRVELLIPIVDSCSKRRLLSILEQHQQDNCCAWNMQADGTYSKNASIVSEHLINSQNRVRKTSQSTVLKF